MSDYDNIFDMFFGSKKPKHEYNYPQHKSPYKSSTKKVEYKHNDLKMDDEYKKLYETYQNKLKDYADKIEELYKIDLRHKQVLEELDKVKMEKSYLQSENEKMLDLLEQFSKTIVKQQEVINNRSM